MKKLKISQLALLGFLVLATFTKAGAETSLIQVKLPVERFTLPNGLTVLMHVDRSVPLVTYHTWFRVGSRNEEPGSTGIAHLFEHLMFKGAKRYGPKEFDKALRGVGGTNNAFTSYDYTGYYETLPSEHLELAIDLESDRMENLALTEENLKSEREVVKEERRFRVDNSVTGKLKEETYSTVFKVHPYRFPVIGLMDDLNKITLEKCREFYTTYYAPNNAVIVVVGDFEPENAKRLIKKYYGHMKAKEIPQRKITAEPIQTAARQTVFEKEAQSDYVTVAYQNARSDQADFYALDILSLILAEGNSSRLYKSLVYNTQLATGVSVSNPTSLDPGIFKVSVSVKPGMSRQRVERIVFDEIWRARNMTYSERELLQAKNRIMTLNVEQLKDIYGKATALAFNEIVRGSYEYLFKDLESYSKVSAKDIQRVASRYLTVDKRNLIVQKAKVSQ